MEFVGFGSWVARVVSRICVVVVSHALGSLYGEKVVEEKTQFRPSDTTLPTN